MRKSERPAIGTTLWAVHEHFYYIPQQVAPVKEYCVCDSIVTGFYEGRYVEIITRGKLPDLGLTPQYYKLSDLGKQVFFTPQEAAELAKRMTEQYERTWGWTNDPPMRRTWEVYLA